MINALALQTLRVLAVEAIDEAKSGHPGMALGAASIIYTLYTKHLISNSDDPKWLNRDRFILSAGHASALLYANLHLAGYKISLNNLKDFRQLNSLTPGHPEVHLTEGVDATSGPLGQGLAEAVGLAVAEAHLHERYPHIIDHYTYAICSDGDLQEGVAFEALSLAGHLQLNKLIVLFDSNDIQLDGPVSDNYSDSIALKMQAMNWHYLKVDNGNDIESIDKAISKAKSANQPTLIEIKTIIGYGASNQGTSSVHGSPLRQEDVIALRSVIGGERFSVDPQAYLAYLPQKEKSKTIYKKWQENLKSEDLKAFTSLQYYDVYKYIPPFTLGLKQATRVTSGKIIKELSLHYQDLIGGSADLSSSTQISGLDGNFSRPNRLGRNLKFGVREHAMAALTNGLRLHGGLKPFCSGFFVFSDYMKPAIRLSALMDLGVIYIFTHDSIAVGEDGPTHQPIEQLTMLRSIPGLITIRPADANEVRSAYQFALNSHNRPVALVLTRQELKTFIPVEKIALEKGAYIVSEEENPEGLLIATGSEVSLVTEAAALLKQEGYNVRVISLPSTNLYEAQSAEYKESIMPAKITKRLAVEMSEGAHLWRYVGSNGEVFALNTFGKSGKGNVVIEAMGFTVMEIVRRYKALK